MHREKRSGYHRSKDNGYLGGVLNDGAEKRGLLGATNVLFLIWMMARGVYFVINH